MEKKHKIKGDDPKFSRPNVPGKGYRVLEIDGENWAWRYGYSKTSIRFPDGNGVQVESKLISDTVWNEGDEEGRDVVMPGLVSAYIRSSDLMKTWKVK